MILYHIAQCANIIVEASTTLEANLLADADLDMINRLIIPNILENEVTKAQRQQVLYGIFACVITTKILNDEVRVYES